MIGCGISALVSVIKFKNKKKTVYNRNEISYVSINRNMETDMQSPVEFANVLAGITDPVLMRKFIREILTPKEIDDFALRWQLVKELYRGDTQRTIATRHHISLCKITRGSKILKKKNSVTRSILDNLMHNEEEKKT